MAEPFQYAIVQLVPRVERDERVNVGVILFSRPLEYLGMRTNLDVDLVQMFAPQVDLDVVQRHLSAMERIASGAADAGPIAQLSQSERFHWLVAPSSTMLQTTVAHTGVCDDADAKLTALADELITRPGA